MNKTSDTFAPLAARLRPKTINEYVGQEHLLAVGKPLRAAIENGLLHSMIFGGRQVRAKQPWQKS